MNIGLGLGSHLRTETNPYGLSRFIIKPGGHQQLVEDLLIPAYERGGRVFLRHRPHGEESGGEMDLDTSAVIARDPEWSWLLDDYDESCKLLAKHCPEAEVIDYFGTVEESFNERLSAGEFSDHLYRLWHSVRRPLNHPNVSIGFDASASYRMPDGSPYEHFVRLIRSYKNLQGRNVYVEAFPSGNFNSWSMDFDSLFLHRFFDNRQDRDYDNGKRNLCWLSGHSREWVEANGVQAFFDVCEERKFVPILLPEFAELV